MDKNNNNTNEVIYELDQDALNLFSMGRVGQEYDDIVVDVLAEYVLSEYVRLHPNDVVISSENRELLKTLYIPKQ